MQTKTNKHEIKWTCFTCCESFHDFSEIVEHVTIFHDEYVKNEPSLYIFKQHVCKKCTFTTDDNNDFFTHWKFNHT